MKKTDDGQIKSS